MSAIVLACCQALLFFDSNVWSKNILTDQEYELYIVGEDALRRKLSSQPL